MEVQQGSKYIQLCRQRAVVSERCTQCHVIHVYMYMYIIYTCTCIVYILFNTPHVHVLMSDEKEERSKQGQTNNKAKQHSTPKAVTFPKKNELPQVGLKPATL